MRDSRGSGELNGVQHHASIATLDRDRNRGCQAREDASTTRVRGLRGRETSDLSGVQLGLRTKGTKCLHDVRHQGGGLLKRHWAMLNRLFLLSGSSSTKATRGASNIRFGAWMDDRHIDQRAGGAHDHVNVGTGLVVGSEVTRLHNGRGANDVEPFFEQMHDAVVTSDSVRGSLLAEEEVPRVFVQSDRFSGRGTGAE